MPTVTDAPVRPSQAARPAVRPPRALRLAVGLALLVGVLVRLGSRSDLWLDEALSVHIAVLPLADLPAALRRDGAPPVYYVLLHGWTGLFGTSDAAVRGLSVVAGLLSLPLAWLAGARLHSRAAGWTALLLLASSPFAVRYATETRMYALVVLLVLLGVLALHAALEQPRPARLAAVALTAAVLALTHYWALFLLAVVGAGLLVAAVRGPRRAASQRCAAALAAAGLLFLPWLPTFLFQAARTGAPWARPPRLSELVTTWSAWSGPGLPGAVLGTALLVLVLAAPLLRPAPGGVLLAPPVSWTALALSTTAVGTLALGLVVTVLQPSGFALRYSAVAVVPALLAAALALQALPPRGRAAAVAALVLLGTATTVRLPFDDRRTQAGATAAALTRALAPGDLVLYCPDQLGPAVSRLLPPGTDQRVYPTGGRPQRVDWVDYADRNRAGDPRAFARDAATRAPGAVWLVWAPGYRTFGRDCQQLDSALQAERGGRTVVLARQRRFEEQHRLVRYPAPRTAP